MVVFLVKKSLDNKLTNMCTKLHHFPKFSVPALACVQLFIVFFLYKASHFFNQNAIN